MFFRPELFEFESLLGNDNRTNLEHAFNVANKEFLVPKLLDPEGEKKFPLPLLVSSFSCDEYNVNNH